MFHHGLFPLKTIFLLLQIDWKSEAAKKDSELADLRRTIQIWEKEREKADEMEEELMAKEEELEELRQKLKNAQKGQVKPFPRDV